MVPFTNAQPTESSQLKPISSTKLISFNSELIVGDLNIFNFVGVGLGLTAGPAWYGNAYNLLARA